MYIVGLEYVYVEVWKFFVVDGVVMRSVDGKEVRIIMIGGWFNLEVINFGFFNICLEVISLFSFCLEKESL